MSVLCAVPHAHAGNQNLLPSVRYSGRSSTTSCPIVYVQQNEWHPPWCALAFSVSSLIQRFFSPSPEYSDSVFSLVLVRSLFVMSVYVLFFLVCVRLYWKNIFNRFSSRGLHTSRWWHYQSSRIRDIRFFLTFFCFAFLLVFTLIGIVNGAKVGLSRRRATRGLGMHSLNPPVLLYR